MSDFHDMLYPPKEQDRCVSHRRYDSKERLIAWSLRQDDHFLLFRVDTFQEIMLEIGEKIDVPETIRCCYSQQDIDPNAAFAENTGAEVDPLGGFYIWAGRELDAEKQLQYNKARFYDPTPGRWISEEPLGDEPGNDNFYPYPH